jgi:hypothetical protein
MTIARVMALACFEVAVLIARVMNFEEVFGELQIRTE